MAYPPASGHGGFIIAIKYEGIPASIADLIARQMTPAPDTGRLLVIIPALNEEQSIRSVVRRVREAIGSDVLVIDDGSTDRTAEFARAAGAHVIRHPFNLGVGAAVRTAFRFALAAEYSRVLQVDGDGQHDPTECRKLLDQLETATADLLVGSRFQAGYRVSLPRRTAMRGLSRLVSRKLGVPITDSTSGFRGYSQKAIEYFADAYPTDYLSDTVESLLLARDANLAVREVPVRMDERQGGTASTNTLSATYYFVRLMLVVCLHDVRKN
jgi:glycosyltransferase involved in cell wall biosynthesis